MTHSKTALLACTILMPMLGSAAPASPARAQEQGVAFAGGVVGKDQGAYAGATVALPGARLGRGWAVREALSGSDYKYANGTDTVKGRQVRSDLSLIHQASGAWGYFNLGPSVRYTHTRLSPADPGNPSSGSKWDVAATADGARVAGPWQVGAFGSYGFGDKDHYVRVDVTHALVGGFRIGLEGVHDGDKTYQRRRAGLLLTIAPKPGVEVRLSIGGLRSDVEHGAYGTIGLSRTF